MSERAGVAKVPATFEKAFETFPFDPDRHFSRKKNEKVRPEPRVGNHVLLSTWSWAWLRAQGVYMVAHDTHRGIGWL